MPSPTGVLVVTETLPAERGGHLHPLSLEALAAAQRLAASLQMPVSAAILASPEAAPSLAAALTPHSLHTIHTLAHPLLERYTADAFTQALQQLIQQLEPACVVFPHTYQVRDFAPALATRFAQLLIPGVIAIQAAAGGAPTFVRQLMQGKLNADYRPTSAGPAQSPCFLSVQAGSFRTESLAPATAPAAIEPFTPALDPATIRTTPGAPFRESAHTVDLASAPVIVSVGRGIREQDNIPLVQALAAALRAELAASRPICDAGWLPLDRQVGSSGQTVAPKLYLAVGISGAIQHLVGMKAAKTVVAINKDPHAPIFEVADYGVAADLFDILPALTQAIHSAKP